MPEPTDGAAPTLRERQSERVRQDLRSAFVRLAVDQGLHAFSLHDVAEAAGVSDRTLYRYYPGRGALIDDVLDEAAALVDAAQGDRPSDGGLDHPDSVAGAFESFEEHADLVRTSVRIREAGLRDERHEARTAAVRRFVEDSDVDPRARDALAVLVRMLTGSDAWIRMTSPEFGLDSREAGLAAHWAVQVLVRAAGGHEGPLRPIFDDEAGPSDATSGAASDVDHG